jgi:hypothetical protein
MIPGIMKMARLWSKFLTGASHTMMLIQHLRIVLPLPRSLPTRQ